MVRARDQQAAQLVGGGGSRINWPFHLGACRRWESNWVGEEEEEEEAEGRAEKRGKERKGVEMGVTRLCLSGTPRFISS